MRAIAEHRAFYSGGRRLPANGRIMASRPGRWFQFAGQRSRVRQRNPRLTISGALTTAQFLELDHHVVPATQPNTSQPVLTGDNPDPRPCQAAERRPIGISRDDEEASPTTFRAITIPSLTRRDGFALRTSPGRQ